VEAVVVVEIAVVPVVVTVEAAEVAEEVPILSLMTTLSPPFERDAPASAGPTKVNVKRLSHFQHTV